MDVSVSLGFANKVNEDGEVVESAVDQLKHWIYHSKGPFWTYWIEYCVWEGRTPRAKPRVWRYSWVRGAKDSPKATEPSPNWSSLTSPEFIARLVVRFLNAAISDDVVFNQTDEESAFAHAYAPKEQDAFKLSHEWFRKEVKNSLNADEVEGGMGDGQKPQDNRPSKRKQPPRDGDQDQDKPLPRKRLQS
ncbi:MAG: hypothetical protein M1839_002148 [Geoglossum umbratile]|nr:MAG: hypothetical protein M1839_002148 [Geoglossum umbratile]